MQDRIRFEMAIHILGWARVVHALGILLLSKTLIRGDSDILNNNGFLYATLNQCGNFVAQIPQNWRKNQNDDLFSCMGIKCPQSVFLCLCFEPGAFTCSIPLPYALIEWQN